MNKSLSLSFLPALMLSLLLPGCGGSSSNTVVEPEEDIEYVFSLSAKLANECGGESAFTDVELLLQDESWQTISTYSANEEGIISFVTESEFINYTLIAKDQKGDEAEGLNIVSFYQANSATASKYIAQFDKNRDNANCECVTQNLELSHRPFVEQSYTTSSLSYDSVQVLDETSTLFEGVEVCREKDANWPVHSFSVAGTDVNDRNISAAIFIDDFSANDDGIWLDTAVEVAESVSLSGVHQDFITSQRIANTSHFTTSVSKDDSSFLVFDSHSYISEVFYQSLANVTFTETSSKFGSAVIKTHHQLISEVAQESFAVKASEQKPALDDIYFSEIDPNSDYDYSAVAGYPMAVIEFTFTTYDPDTKLLMPAKWTFYGPESGTLAISAPLTGYDDIVDNETDLKFTEVTLLKNLNAATYQDYVKYYQAGNTVDAPLDISDDFEKNIHSVTITIE